MIVLVPINEDGEDGVALELSQSHIHVGHGAHNDLVLDGNDPAASYEHAVIAVLGDRAVVVCEPTANPTYIDGADISGAPEEERQLHPGDIVSFGKGKSIFRVHRVGELEEPPKRTPRAAPPPLPPAPPPLPTAPAPAPSSIYPLTVQVFKGEQLVREQSFNQPLIRVGRMRSSHLHLDDKSVSRTHAVIEVSGDGEVLLIDLDSSSGTAVNGKRVKKAILNPGDELNFGDARVLLSFGKTRRPQKVSGVPRLLVRRQGSEQEEILLTKPQTTIGRLAESDIQLDDSTVSGKHAMLVAEAGLYLILDQQSTNGTYLNGERCTGESLRDGDVIHIGRFELVFVAPGPAPRALSPHTEILSPEAARAMFAKVGGRRGRTG